MNNNHLPAGRGAHSGPAMGGGMNGHPGGGNAGRGGGSRRGRNYNNGGNYYNNNYGNGNGRHNNGQHNNGAYNHNQYQNQAYPAYANGFPVPANSYAQMPYMQGNGMANGYAPYQPGYGRGAPANNQFSPMGPPMVMHGAMPPQPFVPHQQQPPQPFQPHTIPPHPQPPHPQHMPPHNYPRSTPQAPMIVSSAQHHQMPIPPVARYPAGPPAGPPVGPPIGFPPYAHAPLGANGLPLSLPPHIPPPAHLDYEPEYTNGAHVPHPVAIAPEFYPAKLTSTASPDALATPASGPSSQPSEAPTKPDDTREAKAPSEAQSMSVSVAPSVAASDVSVLPTFGDITVSETDASVAVTMPKTKVVWSTHPDEAFPSRRKARRNKKRDLGGVTNVDMPQGPAEAAVAAQTPKAAQAQMAAPSPAPAAPAAPAPVSRPTSSSGPAPPPAVPVVPVLPIRTAPVATAPITAPGPGNADAKTCATTAANGTSPKTGIENARPVEKSTVDKADETSSNGEAAPATPATPTAPAVPAAPAAPAAPTSWANLFAKKASAASAAQTGTDSGAAVNGHAANGTNGATPFPQANNSSLVEAISTYQVRKSGQVAFIEPRGLYNSGNMCYMHAVLQGLTFCTPFYDFLDQIGQKAVHSFKSETPMLDAMISHIREFKVIDRAEPAELRRRLKNADFDRHGDPFTPEFVYRATRDVPRFSSMVHGHQQDAEEFLGFLLESLNDECTKVVRSNSSRPTSSSGTPSGSATPETADGAGDGWLEVGHRQKTAVMQSSGHVSGSPVNSIFLSQLRSELNVPGRQASVTVEPYQTLQLHIDSPEVHNIVDALRGMTVPEVVRLESAKGGEVTASKRLYIQTLPPVLILHLKRFQFDSGIGNGGSVKKISKKIGYPLELDIPRELFSHGSKRGALQSEPLPKYRLNAVVYHHGKQASGGHYTVDVLRGDGCEWIRLDDTSIRRITKMDVTEAGAENPAPSKTNGAAATNGNAGDKREAAHATNGTANRFAGIDGDDASQGGSGWSAPVNGNGKKWSAVAGNASAAPPKPKPAQDSIKDNKVAYLLFYQRIN